MNILSDQKMMDLTHGLSRAEGDHAIAEAAHRETLKTVKDWGDKFCVNTEHYGISKYVNKRQRECRECWNVVNQSGEE